MAVSDRLITAMIGAESGGNPMARNPRSSAGGLGQFIDSTWLATVKKHRPDIAAGKTDAQLLQLKFDPALSAEMTAAYARDNQEFLQSRGLPATDSTTYLAHFAGPQGAAALLANPQASVEATLGRDAVRANPFLRGKTGADVAEWAAGKVNESPAAATARRLRERFGTRTAGGVEGGSGDATMAGGSGFDRLRAAMAPKPSTYDPNRLAEAQRMLDSGQQIAGSSGNALGAIGGTILAGIGGARKEAATEAQKADQAEMMQNLQSAIGNPAAIAQVLISSSDPNLRTAGIKMAAELAEAQQKAAVTPPQTREIDGPYGTKILQEWSPSARSWTTVNPQGSPAPQSAPVTGGTPQPGVMPQAAPAPSGPMLGGPEIPTENIGQVGPSGIPQQSRPAQQAPQLLVMPNPVPKVPEGFVQRPGPNGGFLYMPDGTPVLDNKAEAEARGKARAETETQRGAEQRAAQQFAGGLEQLRQLPQDFGRMATERALGPWSADTPDSGTISSSVGAALSFIPQQLARGVGELQAASQGGASPTEVRDRINTATKNLAAVMKPLVRKPGEGAWSDKDQANLEAQLGNLQRSRSVEEYNRRLDDIRENISKIFLVPVPPEQAAQGRRMNAPDTAEEESTRFYEEFFARNR